MRCSGWRSWRDVLYDVGPAVVLLVVGELDVVFGLSIPYGNAPWWTAVGPVAIACLALLLRRHRPLLALAIVLAVLALPALFWHTELTYWGEFVVILVAMYSTGRHLPWQHGIWAFPLFAAGYGTLLVFYPRMRDPGDVLFNAALVAALWGAGRLSMSWTAARDRALRLEVERVLAEERAEVRERARIARELHDVISHTITVIVMQAGGARLASASDPQVAVGALEGIESLGRDSLAELRTLLAVLRSDDRAEIGTAPQPTIADIPMLCERMGALGLPVTQCIDTGPDPVPPGLQLAAYRIAQEGLTNVLKHAGTVDTVVNVQITTTDLIVSVQNAAGSRLPRMPGAARGLAGLRERVGVLDGTLHAGPAAGGGFDLSARIPLAVSV